MPGSWDLVKLKSVFLYEEKKKMDLSDSQNLFFEALAKIFGDGPSSFDGSFFRDSSIVSTLDQFSKTLLWMRNHPEIDFDIWIRSFDTTSVIIEYSNGLTRREHSVEETNLIRLSFLDNFLNRKGVVGFYQVLEKIEKVPKGTYFDSHHPSLHLFIRFSGGEIDVKEYESNKDYKNLRKKTIFTVRLPGEGCRWSVVQWTFSRRKDSPSLRNFSNGCLGFVYSRSSRRSVESLFLSFPVRVQYRSDRL